MNIENVHRFIEDFEALDDAPIIANRRNYCEDCNIEMLINNDHYVCHACGIVGDYIAAQEVLDHQHTKKILYRRRLYCIDKLKQISCLKSPRTTEYKEIIKKLSIHDFSNIHELYDLMKDLDMHKFYKNIYDVYFSIKKLKLITLNYEQINTITDDFINIESKFKAIDNNTRKNMFNYNSLIQILLEKHNITGSNNMILPFNHDFMKSKIQQLL